MAYELDMHCQMILDEYLENREMFCEMRTYVIGVIQELLATNGILVTAVEGRVKTEKSLAGKLELKGQKYNMLSDITDILGCRVITFYSDDVDKIAALIEANFEVDWENSVDKRKMLQLDTFGYQSLHYIVRIPKNKASNPRMCEYKFEIQLRTALQHVWANMYHDTGYKSGVEIPREYLRNLNRIAGMLELADEQFSLIRNEIGDYRRKVSSLVSSGNFDEVPLNGSTYENYLKLQPFDPLLKKIAAINQAEIYESSNRRYLPVLQMLGLKTLGDLARLVKNYSDFAYDLARHEIGTTDLDIISRTVAIQDLVIVYILKNNLGMDVMVESFDAVGGNHNANVVRAQRIYDLSKNLSFMNK